MVLSSEIEFFCVLVGRDRLWWWQTLASHGVRAYEADMAFETYVVIEGLRNSAYRVRNMLASAPFPILAGSTICHQAFFYFSKISLNLMCVGLGKKIWRNKLR